MVEKERDTPMTTSISTSSLPPVIGEVSHGVTNLSQLLDMSPHATAAVICRSGAIVLPIKQAGSRRDEGRNGGQYWDRSLALSRPLRAQGSLEWTKSLILHLPFRMPSPSRFFEASVWLLSATPCVEGPKIIQDRYMCSVSLDIGFPGDPILG